jgi:hypothetical protein
MHGHPNELVTRSWRQQGLAERVTDPTAPARVAGLVAAAGICRGPPGREATPAVVAHRRGQHPSEPLNSHEERNLVMRHEPTGSCPPVQQAPRTRCPACGQAMPLADVPATLAGRSSRCPDCRRAAARVASRRRAAAMRLLIAAYPEEWAGLLGLVAGRRQPATRPTGGGHRG